MKSFILIGVIVLSTASPPAHANRLGGILDDMFVNISSPGVVENGLRGAITGGSAYVRSPIVSVQAIAMDPPRFSAGCGGIDLFMGSFSFISSEKLTQFIRAVAQNAAPLAFKMAIDTAFPQLGGLLDKFQQIAQDMNALMRNSCQMAQGLVSSEKNPGAMAGLVESVTSTISTARGWASDIAEAAAKVTTEPSQQAQQANALQNSDGSKAVPILGNHTWNALNQRQSGGQRFDIASNETLSKQIIMSLIGTTVLRANADPDKPAEAPVYGSTIRLKDLVDPVQTTAGTTRGVRIYSCPDIVNCENITEIDYETWGVAGYVRQNLYGGQSAMTPLDDSIIRKMSRCVTPDCGLTAEQESFLRSVGNIPVLGLLRRTQHLGSTMDTVAAMLFDVLVDEVAAVYGRHVLDVARVAFSGARDVPVPKDYLQTIAMLSADVGEIELRAAQRVFKMNQAIQFVETANRTRPGHLSYRP